MAPDNPAEWFGCVLALLVIAAEAIAVVAMIRKW